MNIWGITGTNGKTTTTWVLSEFLRAGGRRCGYVTTVEVDTGSRRFSTGYTTPPLEVLKGIFAEMEVNGLTDCVMEVSSHAIHQRRFGDTVFAGGGYGRYDLPGSDGNLLFQSIAAIMRIEGERRMLYGHGEESLLSEEKKFYNFS